MTNLAHKPSAEFPSAKASGDVIEIYRAPQISIHAFCETTEVISALNTFSRTGEWLGRIRTSSWVAWRQPLSIMDVLGAQIS